MDDELHAMERRLVALRRRKDATEAVCVERERQDSRWGEQNHPMVWRGVNGSFGPESVARNHRVPYAWQAKRQCEDAAEEDALTWADILVEEVAEWIEAAAIHGDLSDEARTEAVQVAAVALAIIECIDRKRAAEGGDGDPA